jgi:hypothetical protein
MLSQHLKSVALAVAIAAWAVESLAVTLDIRVNASANDAGQTGTTVNVTSTTLNLSNEDWIGARFADVTIPQGAYIISAYVAFTANDADAGNFSTTVYGEAADNSSVFTTGSSNISSRSRKVAAVCGVIPAIGRRRRYKHVRIESRGAGDRKPFWLGQRQ